MPEPENGLLDPSAVETAEKDALETRVDALEETAKAACAELACRVAALEKIIHGNNI